ncbi:glycosyltransferase [Leucobacter sp. HY1910]
MVASTGGHLSQLVRLAERENAADDSVWVTFDSPQSRSMLRGKRVLWVDYIAPRDLRGTVKAYRHISANLNPRDFDGVLSTGAAVAVAGLAWARRHYVPAVYVESVSRTDGPSLTGRIVQKLRLAELYTQHASWASAKWQLTPSVLNDFAADTPRPLSGERAGLKVLVTLGTIKPYRFDSVVDRLVDITGPEDEIVWQLGETSRSGLQGRSHDLMPADQLLAEAKAADVVVTHSGVGTILQMLDSGISPVVVPRLKERGEHIDDHQLQIWRLLDEAGIGSPVQVQDLSRDTLTSAASKRVRVLS